MAKETEVDQAGTPPGTPWPDGKTELEHGLSAKRNSHLAQIFAALWIVGNTILKALGLSKLEMGDIIYSGIAIAAIFMPVYFSIFLDKIKDIKFTK